MLTPRKSRFYFPFLASGVSIICDKRWYYKYFSCSATADTYGQAASNLVAGSNLEQTIQQLMDMGGGNWDRETVMRALRAAYNNPERAVDYLYSVCLNSLNLPMLFLSCFNY